MSKNLKQIALIQHRTGHLDELPTQLNKAEFGFASDTNDLFIGNPTNPVLAKRIEENVFPHGNVQILTEFTDNLNMLKYHYQGNDIKMPITLIAENSYLGVQPSKMYLNDVELSFSSGMLLQEIVDMINLHPDLNLRAYITNIDHLALTSTEFSIIMENIEFSGDSGPIELLGFSKENQITALSTDTPTRTLQEVLDDRVSIHNFGVFGDGNKDDTESMYNGILGLYLSNVSTQDNDYKEILFPAGKYIVRGTLPLPTGCNLKGEGIGRTIIKGMDIFDAPLFATMDDGFVLSNNPDYGRYSPYPHTITISNMTLDMSESAFDIIDLGTSSNIEFINVEFINVDGKTSIKATGEVSNIRMHGCSFVNGSTAISSINGSIIKMIATNNMFTGITTETIQFTPSEGNKVSQVMIDNSTFTNCGTKSNLIISLNERTEYNRITNSLYDKDVMTGVSPIIQYNSESHFNFCDSWSGLHNRKQFLGFGFTQLEWKYVETLTNPNGEDVVQITYNGTEVDGEIVPNELTNSISIEQGDVENDNTVKIYGTSEENNISIGAGRYGDISIGESTSEYPQFLSGYEYSMGDKIERIENDEYLIYVCLINYISISEEDLVDPQIWSVIGRYAPSIKFERDINLNSSSIADFQNDITFKTTDQNILTIIDDYNQEVEGSLKYADRIGGDANAIVNRDYVTRIAQQNKRKILNYAAVETATSNPNSTKLPLLKILDLSKETYGDETYLDKISFNVRVPYYSVLEQLNTPPDWEANTAYEVGFIVTHDNLNYSCLVSHTSSTDFLNDSDNWSYIPVPISALEWIDGVLYTVGDVVYYIDPSNDSKDYYMCINEHISDIAAEELLNGLQWRIVYPYGNDYNFPDQTVELNDLKYVSIIADNGADSKWRLLPTTLIDVSLRNTNSQTYRSWDRKTDYVVGDKVTFKNKFYECVSDHTSIEDPREIYDYSKWSYIYESGFNYTLDFDRTVDKLDYLTEQVIPQTESVPFYNLAGYTLYLELLDYNGDRLSLFTLPSSELEPGTVTPQLQVNSAGTISISISFIRNEEEILVG